MDADQLIIRFIIFVYICRVSEAGGSLATMAWIFFPCLVFGFFPTPNSRPFVNLGDTLGLGTRNCTTMRQCILDSAEFLACYELLLKEVVCPFLKFKMIEDMVRWHESE